MLNEFKLLEVHELYFPLDILKSHQQYLICIRLLIKLLTYQKVWYQTMNRMWLELRKTWIKSEILMQNLWEWQNSQVLLIHPGTYHGESQRQCYMGIIYQIWKESRVYRYKQSYKRTNMFLLHSHVPNWSRLIDSITSVSLLLLQVQTLLADSKSLKCSYADKQF